MSKKARMHLHNFILECITVAALIGLMAASFTIDLWPYKTMVLIIVCGGWLLLFATVNGFLEVGKCDTFPGFEED